MSRAKRSLFCSLLLPQLFPPHFIGSTDSYVQIRRFTALTGNSIDQGDATRDVEDTENDAGSENQYFDR